MISNYFFDLVGIRTLCVHREHTKANLNCHCSKYAKVAHAHYFWFVHLAHPNLRACELFCNNSLAEVDMQVLTFNYM